MKYSQIFFILLLVAPDVFAERFSPTIHSIDFGKTNQSHLVRFDNTRVGFVEQSDDDHLRALVETSQRSGTIEVEVDKENNVVAAQSDASSQLDPISDSDSWGTPTQYRPSIVKDLNEALRIFKRMRKDYRLSGECYNRAHIWAFGEFQRTKLNSMKIFMFFTERYIRKYKYHWWFHVTPMVYKGNLSSPRTLDRRYTSGPLQTKTWSDVFIKSKLRCAKVNKFDDYWLNQKSRDCYHIYTSMYYVIPRDIEKRDVTGMEKVEFNDREIRRAYQNGFKP